MRYVVPLIHTPMRRKHALTGLSANVKLRLISELRGTTVVDSLVRSTVDDLKAGVKKETPNLAKVISEVEQAQKSLSKEDYKKYADNLNAEIRRQGVFPKGSHYKLDHNLGVILGKGDSLADYDVLGVYETSHNYIPEKQLLLWNDKNKSLMYLKADMVPSFVEDMPTQAEEVVLLKDKTKDAGDYLQHLARLDDMSNTLSNFGRNAEAKALFWRMVEFDKKCLPGRISMDARKLALWEEKDGNYEAAARILKDNIQTYDFNRSYNPPRPLHQEIILDKSILVRVLKEGNFNAESEKIAKELQSPYGNGLGSWWNQLCTPDLGKLASKFKYLTDPKTKGQDCFPYN